MPPLIVTSVNPFSKIAQQKTCFERWGSLGYKVLSFNSENEAERLLEAGFKKEDIITISIEETAEHIFGKEIPRILPLMRRVLELNYSRYFLVNSDIYAAHRKPVDSFLSSVSDSVALTRSECVHLAYNKFFDFSPYRGGLDIFFFSRSGLRTIVTSLEKNSVSERMTFGVPGWDYYVGHTIIQQGGKIMDGEVFLHQSHQTSYGAIDEFKIYAEEMLSTGVYQHRSSDDMAVEFSRKIELECKKNNNRSRMLKSIYYQAPRIKGSDSIDRRVHSVFSRLTSILSSHGITFSPPGNFKGFLDSQLQHVNWMSSTVYRKNEIPSLPVIQGKLILLAALLLLQEEQGKLVVSTSYPDGNLHGLALRQIIDSTVGPNRLDNLLDLFASELVEHSIFNAELFKYFVLSSNSKKSISICTAVLSIICKGFK